MSSKLILEKEDRDKAPLWSGCPGKSPCTRNTQAPGDLENPLIPTGKNGAFLEDDGSEDALCTSYNLESVLSSIEYTTLDPSEYIY